MNRTSRRTFIRQSAALSLSLASRPARAIGVNERLNVGFIGLGGRGKELLQQFGQLTNVRIAALCDVDEQRLDEVGDQHKDARRYGDLRKLLDDPDVDAVVIATCNHWHALAAILACQAGKDVYVEKPLAHNHWEGQQLVRAARHYDRVVQMGTQQRSDPLQDELKQYLHDDQALGPIQFVRVCRFGERAPIGKRAMPLEPPKSVNYDLWLGPASDEPIYRDKLHYDWHWVWNTGNGEMGNWGIHVLDDAVNVVLRDRVPFPKRIFAAATRAVWHDAGETPNVCFVCYETGTVPILFALSNLPAEPVASGKGSPPTKPAKNESGNPDSKRERRRRRGLEFDGVGSGYVIHCEGGSYAGGRGGGNAKDHDGNIIRPFKGDSGAGHARNFVEAVLAHDRKKLNSEVQIGHQSTSWCNLANIAMRISGSYDHQAAASKGQPRDAWAKIVDQIEQNLSANGVKAAAALRLSPMLEFDANREQFIGDHSTDANRLLRREYRVDFELPTIA